MAEPKRVLVTGAAGQIGYSLVFSIAKGDLLGHDTPIILHLLDIPFCQASLEGVVMELEDCAFPNVKQIVATTDAVVGFAGVDYAILVGSFPRREGMERKELLEKNVAIFKEQGKLLNEVASKQVKVLVVGNPANTNGLVAQYVANGLPKESFSALTRLDHNRAKAQIALRLGVNAQQVKNVVIWGNHSSTQYPDVSHGYVQDYPSVGVNTSIRDAVKDDNWLNDHFISVVQKRGAAIIAARKFSSAASAANAIVDHLRNWIFGSGDEIVSMAVPSDGSYGIPEGYMFSYPVKCANGTYHIVQGLNIDEFSRGKLEITLAELKEEKEAAFSFLGI